MNIQQLWKGKSGTRWKRPQMARRAWLKLRQLARGNSGARVQRKIVDQMRRALKLNSDLSDLKLPSRFGLNLPERAPEILLARLSYQAGARVLDIGHANAQWCHLQMLQGLEAPLHLTGIDIAPPDYDTTQFYEKSVRGDICDPNCLDEKFDLIWCISTLEHFGLDNSGYTDAFQMDTSLDAKAFMRMIELLAPGGSLLVTVPFGKAENHGWMRNYDLARWQSLLALAPPDTTRREWYFRHTKSGWKMAPPETLGEIAYYSDANGGAGAMAAVFISRA